jgi:transposase
MNREEREQHIVRLYNDGKSIREIAKDMHISFRDIAAIIKKVKSEAHGKSRSPSEEDDGIKSKSKTSQAFKLFSEGERVTDVAIALDLPADQVQAIYLQFWELEDMYKLAQIYEQAKYDLDDLLELHRTVKALGMEKQDIIHVLEFGKHNQLQTLQAKVKKP